MNSGHKVIKKMKRNLLFKQFFRHLLGMAVLCLCSLPIEAQITIGDITPPHPSAILEVKSHNKRGIILPKVGLDSINDNKTIPDAAHSLLVYNTKSSIRSRFASMGNWVIEDMFYYWNDKEKKWVGLVGKTDKSVTIMLVSLGVPRPALFTLNGTSYLWATHPDGHWPDMKGYIDPLKNTAPGESKVLPFTEVINYTNNMITMTNNTITFQPGIYNIIFSYEFVTAKFASGGSITPNSCTEPMYFIDFPMNTKLDDGTIANGFVRKYAGTQFYFLNYPGEDNSYIDHGGSIEFLTTILEETQWEIKLGRGYGGNCENLINSNYRGFAMPNRSVFLYIERLNDLDKIAE